ncbi:MAG: hypothetical protein OEM62_02335 [Acidobacteriota bacterium]|nr:hypothetical protein [Acidobacteriota bacterium]
MNENYWKIAAVAGIACLQMTFAWGRLNAWSTITGIILLFLLMTIPWRTHFAWAERGAYATTMALALVLASGRLYEDRLDADFMSRPRQAFAIWTVLALTLFVLKTWTGRSR